MTRYSPVADNPLTTWVGQDMGNTHPFFMLSLWWFQRKHQTRQSNRTETRYLTQLPHKDPSDPWRVQGMPPLPPPARQFLEDKRETLKREKLTHTLAGKELESVYLQRETCLRSWRRPGREISQLEIYTGKMRLVQTNQTYCSPWKIALFWAKLWASPLSARSKQLLVASYPDG